MKTLNENDKTCEISVASTKQIMVTLVGMSAEEPYIP